MDHDFEDIEVKESAADMLEAELIRKRKKCMIGTGSMCDPYMPCALACIIDDEAERHGIMHDQDQVFSFLHSIERDGANGQKSFY
jgi:DNA repair photolyase